MKRYKPKHKNAYTALLTILILGSIASVSAITLLSMGINQIKSSSSFNNATLARSLTSACAEEALMEIRNDTAFSGTGSLTFTQGSCEYEVIVGSGESRTINAQATIQDTTKKTQVTISAINPLIVINGWLEVADF